MINKDIEKKFSKILSDNDNKVIAFTGDWGIGKTYFLNEFKKQHPEEIKESIYISLFGLKDLKQLKLRALRSAIPEYLQNDRASDLFKTIKNAIKNLSKGLIVLDDLALLALGDYLQDKVIIIDDIERKNNALDIDEVMGFIDDCINNYQARFILVFNSKKIASEKYFDYYEKIIDSEIKFKSIPKNSFAIAKKLVSIENDEIHNAIKKAIEICEISNIRIIKKILKIINSIRKNYPESLNIIDRLVPCCVLYAGIFYKGIPDTPNFERIIELKKIPGKLNVLTKNLHKESENKQDDTLVDKYMSLRAELNILFADDFEDIFIDYLKNGDFNKKVFSSWVKIYLRSKKFSKANNLLNDIYNRSLYDRNFSEKELSSLVKKSIDVLSYLDVSGITGLITVLDQNNVDFVDQVISAWKNNLNKSSIEEALTLFHINEIHPKLKDACVELLSKKSKNSSLIEVIANYQHTDADIYRFNSASKDEFMNCILNSPYLELKKLMVNIFKFCHSEAFKNGMDTFFDACRCIYNNEEYKNDKIKKILQLHFKDHKLLEKLEENKTQI